ncbi:hypothetical protein AN958_04085 [Leucoagaricus sp. SymC.cos]|nr:hypothetical protein AN958_04085 [Leucoagaricus sp. SymC.cos]
MHADRNTVVCLACCGTGLQCRNTEPFDAPPAQPPPVSDEIAQLNTMITQLLTQRALLLQRENFQHSSIFKLPSELLAEIFLYADAIDRPIGCSPPKRRHPLTPIRLGAVCTHWRHVAWNSPQLWTQLPLSGCWAWDTKFPLTRVLRTYFQNMKATTLELYIDCFRGRFVPDDTDALGDHPPQEGAFNTIFIENADKIRVLGFKMWPEEWLPHIAKVQETRSFSRLEEIWIKSLGASFDDKLLLANAPRLRKVEFGGASESANITLPFSQITHLTLTDVFSDICLNLLVQCTNLEYFYCDEIGEFSSEGSVVKSTISFPYLKTFHYLDRNVSQTWREALGRHLQFPALESVIWHPDWSGGVERQMLRQYPDSLRTLEFLFRRRDQPKMKHMFIPLDSLEELRIRCWPAIKLSLLDLLTPQTKKRHQLLPSLRKLLLQARTNEMPTRVTQSLLAMIRSRRTLTETKLDHLVLSYRVRSYKLAPWPREFIEGIGEFLREGMTIVIETEGQEMDYDWLQSDTTDSSSRTSFEDISDEDSRQP